MFRRTMIALLGLGLAGALAGCSGGGSTEPDLPFNVPYAFAGTWRFARTVTSDPVGWSADDRGAALGTTYNSRFAITVNGTQVVADDQTAPYPPETYHGTIDPQTGAFTAQFLWQGDKTIRSTFRLQATSDTTMTGTWVSDESASPGFPNGKHMEHSIVATRL